MYGIAKASVVESYGRLVKKLESPKYMDGIYGESCNRWDISFTKNNVHGSVTGSGKIERNGIKINISEKGILKRVSLKALFAGKRGLKMIEDMLNEITPTITTKPQKIDSSKKIRFNLEKKEYWK